MPDVRGRPTRPWVSRTKWLGGSPCSGKSTVLAALSAVPGVASYSCDDRFDHHATLAVAEGRPTFGKVTSTDPCARLAQPLRIQVQDVFGLAAEQWPYVLRDLGQVGDAVIVAEGSALLPDNLRRLGVEPADAVWLVPTPEFQEVQYARRDWARDLVRDCPDPGLAFDRWMGRDARYAAEIAEEARRHGIRVVEVDGSVPPLAIVELVRDQLSLWDVRE